MKPISNIEYLKTKDKSIKTKVILLAPLPGGVGGGFLKRVERK